MKPVSIATQKKLLWIPIVNISILYIWIYNAFMLKVRCMDVLKSNLVMFACAIPGAILMLLVSNYYPALEELMSVICSYLIPLCLGYGLIRFQESL